MIKRNAFLAKLSTNYLFPEIQHRKKEFLTLHPTASIISLGIGDTTLPLPEQVGLALGRAASDFSNPCGYLGYGPEQGIPELREKIAKQFYPFKISPEEVFISDGAKCDIGRLQLLFGARDAIAVQDPSYPVYVDGSVICGVKSIHYLPCTPCNQFFPELKNLSHIDLLYFCSPNNPTGEAATKEQLKSLVDFARENKVLLLFDAAYSSFIRDANCPRTIFEIDGSEEVAIETSSFSKLAGFTGIRLGWTVVPKALRYREGESLWQDWNRLTTTLFNGASRISQLGGLFVLNAQEEVKKNIDYYLENAYFLKKSLESKGLKVYGGVNAPYLWVHFPRKTSWDMFDHFLHQAHLITTPGSGFGPTGEGFLRLSALGSRDDILIASHRIQSLFFE